MRLSTSGTKMNIFQLYFSHKLRQWSVFVCRPYRMLLNQWFSWFCRPSIRWIQVDILQIEANFTLMYTWSLQTHIIFYAWYLPGSTCFDFVNHDLLNCTHQFRLSVRLSPSLQKHAVRLAPIMSVFTTRQNLIKECHLTLHVNIRRMTGISSDFIFVLLVFEDNRYSNLADTRVCLSTCLSVCLSIYTGL